LLSTSASSNCLLIVPEVILPRFPCRPRCGRRPFKILISRTRTCSKFPLVTCLSGVGSVFYSRRILWPAASVFWRPPFARNALIAPSYDLSPVSGTCSWTLSVDVRINPSPPLPTTDDLGPRFFFFFFAFCVSMVRKPSAEVFSRSRLFFSFASFSDPAPAGPSYLCVNCGFSLRLFETRLRFPHVHLSLQEGVKMFLPRLPFVPPKCIAGFLWIV